MTSGRLYPVSSNFAKIPPMRRTDNILTSIGRPFFLIFVKLISLSLYLLLTTRGVFLLFRSKIPHLVILFIFSFSLFYYLILYKLPSPSSLANGPSKLTTQILDRNGKLLFKIYTDENRTLVKIDKLPRYVKNAFISIEDKDFYSHQGFSISGIFRALIRNINLKCLPLRSLGEGECSLEGGSTITQQLVKNALLSPERTITRKIKEIILAIGTEITYDKNTILEMYLNQVGFGGPAYGIQEASQQYFSTDAAKLSLSQAAFLAGLPKAPSKFSPFINPQLAINRQHDVLEAMLKTNSISKDEYLTAVDEKITLSSPTIDIRAPHFVMYVRDLLGDNFSENLVNLGGLKVTTTLDLDIQQFAEKTLNSQLEKISSLNVGNGAVIVTKPSTGEILAMVGSRNYFDVTHSGQVNLTTSLRQPGSSIKPINYALALEKGLSPNTIIKDEPVTFNIPGSSLWSPKNYDGQFHGNVTLRTALANSYNIPAILLLARNGVSEMVDLGIKMGITTWDQPKGRFGLSLTLGSVETKLTDLATVYGTFANGGLTIPLNPILKIEDNSGHILPFSPCPKDPNSCHPRQSIKPETAFIISDILSDNNARSSAFGYNSVLNISPLKAAVKTGTSNNLRDNWTVGYTPDYVVGTWVGNNDNTPMRNVASGITGASPVWAIIIKRLLNNSSNTAFNQPTSVIRVPICKYTGTLPCENCPTIYEFFIKGQEPTKSCIIPSPTPSNTQTPNIL